MRSDSIFTRPVIARMAREVAALAAVNGVLSSSRNDAGGAPWQGSWTNTIDKIYQCPICGRRFTRKYHVQSHFSTTRCQKWQPQRRLQGRRLERRGCCYSACANYVRRIYSDPLGLETNIDITRAPAVASGSNTAAQGDSETIRDEYEDRGEDEGTQEGVG